MARLAAALDPAGLDLRGGFLPTRGDAVPLFATGKRPGTILLVGNAGPRMWAAFSRARGGGVDPLDDWIRATVSAISADFGADCVFPFDGPPHWPFQTWARRAEPVAPSPLGLLIHPVYGLWHAYRAALLLADRLELPTPVPGESPCATCAGRPCLDACPVGAFSETDYDVEACVAHVTSGGGDCAGHGCRARRACPVGTEYAYEPAQAAFHMAGFLRLLR